MRHSNMRVATPIIRSKVELDPGQSANISAILAQAAETYVIPTTQEFEIRIKSVTFRAKDNSSNVSLGEVRVRAFNRELYVIMRSNVQTASVNTDGHAAELWAPVSYDDKEKVATGYFLGDKYVFASTESDSELTTVVNFEIKF